MLSVLGIVAIAGAYSVIVPRTFLRRPLYPSVISGSSDEVYFAPTEDLEIRDLRLLDSAKFKVDIAMYAFTDQRLADELLALANRGVEIRLYRDGMQLSDETSRARRRADQTTTERLFRNSHIQIKVKVGHAIMHLKAYCIDNSVLRIGSANWSESGEHSQDNDLFVLRDPEVVRKFESDFQDLWNRSSNRTDLQVP